MPAPIVKMLSVFILGSLLVGCGSSASSPSSSANSDQAAQQIENVTIEADGSTQTALLNEEVNAESVGSDQVTQPDEDVTVTTDGSNQTTLPNENTNVGTDGSDQIDQPNESENISTDGQAATIGLAVNGYVVVSRTRTWPDSSSQLIKSLEYDYNSNEIIVSKKYSNRNTDPSAQSLMTYDELGNWTGLEDLDETSPFVLDREENIYNSQGYLINHNSYLTSDGRQISANDVLYLSDGRFDSSAGQMRAGLFKAQYNGNKQLVKVNSHRDNSDTSSVQYSIAFKFSENFPSNGEQTIRIASVNGEGSEWFGYDIFYFNDFGNVTSIESYQTDDTLRYRDEFLYELSPEPVFNFWLHRLRFAPHEMLIGFPGE